MKKYIEDMRFSKNEAKKIRDILRYGYGIDSADFFKNGCNITYLRVECDDKLYDIWMMNGEILNFQEV